MTRERLEQIVREWERRLNITHWRITLEWDKPAPDGVYAQITRGGDMYETAGLQFATDFNTWSVKVANEIVAHELLHVVLFDLQAAGDAAEEVLNGEAFKLFDARFMHELEGVVDRLALLLVEFAGPFNPAREGTHVHA
jgi:hypothetical protein